MSLMGQVPAGVFSAFAAEQRTFTVQRQTAVGAGVRKNLTWTSDGVVRGILGAPTTQEVTRFGAVDVPITHGLALLGDPGLKYGDRLVCQNRRFYVRSAVQPNLLGTWTRVLLEERAD